MGDFRTHYGDQKYSGTLRESRTLRKMEAERRKEARERVDLQSESETACVVKYAHRWQRNSKHQRSSKSWRNIDARIARRLAEIQEARECEEHISHTDMLTAAALFTGLIGLLCITRRCFRT